MILTNKSDYNFTNEIEHKLIIWSLYMNSIAKKTEHASIKSLFTEERLRITITLWLIWFALCFAYYGNLMIMPTILYSL